MKELGGFLYWDVEFDREGRSLDPGVISKFMSETVVQVTDLFIFSHGWNNEPWKARRLYDDFFTQLRAVIDQRRVATTARVGIAGVIWPSILFPDDEPVMEVMGAAGFNDHPITDLSAGLKSVFRDQPETVDQLLRLLDEQPNDEEAFQRFQDLLKSLAPQDSDLEESGELALLRNPPTKVFEAMAQLAPAHRQATVGLSDHLSELWRGAKEALRVTTYWQMKHRGGLIGQQGLGPLIGRLDQAAHAVHRTLRVHLLGHSFGCRVVSFALKGLPVDLDGTKSPVKSLFLLQGAFSHFAFADALPHASNRSGALKGMATRVDGPLVVTFSQNDLAVCKRYPLASFISRDDAADFDDALSRWGAMGSRGAQAVNAAVEPFKPIGEKYPFAKSKFLNLDGDLLITRGDPPSGAHSDIIHPEIAWAVLKASGLS